MSGSLVTGVHTFALPIDPGLDPGSRFLFFRRARGSWTPVQARGDEIRMEWAKPCPTPPRPCHNPTGSFPPSTHPPRTRVCGDSAHRSAEHTSELQSLMRISYAVSCLKNKRYEGRHHEKVHDRASRTPSDIPHSSIPTPLTVCL